VTNEHINGVFGWRITQLEETVKQLEAKVDRLAWALVSAAVALAVMSITQLTT
jgi:hypothetical protein